MQPSETTTTQSSTVRPAGWHVPVILLTLGLLLGMLAAYLNHSFYAGYGPFYDSMSYQNRLAQVMTQSTESGALAAIMRATTSTTVVLPWVLAALLGPFLEPSRILGVVFQLPFLFLQLAAGYRCLRVAAEFSAARAIIGALALVAFPGALFFNGGLPDYRMDLSQAYCFGAFLCVLMTARKLDTLREWVVVGAVMAIASLIRATTPVYLVMVLGIVFLVDVRRRALVPVITRYAVSALTLAVLAGWFYVVNFKHLHYYYIIWNPDANARLPFHASVKHVSFLIDHIGWLLLIGLAFSTFAVMRRQPEPGWLRGFRVNWVALVGAMAPVSYLVVSGAGLNPFVSLTSVPGVVLMMLWPGSWSRQQPQSWASRLQPHALGLAIGASLVMSVARFESRISDWIPIRAGIDQLATTIVADAETNGRSRAVVGFLWLGGVDGATLSNHLIFEKKFKYSPDGRLVLRGLSIDIRHYPFGSEVEWKSIPGATDNDKVSHVFKDAALRVDYIVMAESGSRLPDHLTINRYAADVRSMLRKEGALMPIARNIRISRTESASIYRNTGRN